MKRLLVALLLATTPASAQFVAYGSVSQATQTTITDNVVEQINIAVATGVTPNVSTAGKVTAVPNASLNTLVLMVVGDSITANSLPTPHAPVNSAQVLQLNIYDSAVYQATGALLGPTALGGNYSVYLADKLVADAKFGQAILVPVGIGGSTSLDWTPSGVLNQRARVACWTIRAHGWFGNANFKFATIYSTGVNDVTAGTTAQQWQDRYGAWHASMVSYGCDFDTFVPIETRLSNVVSSSIQGAQAAVVGGKTFAGPNTDALTASSGNLQADLTHLSDAGGANNAALWASVLETHY